MQALGVFVATVEGLSIDACIADQGAQKMVCQAKERKASRMKEGSKSQTPAETSFRNKNQRG